MTHDERCVDYGRWSHRPARGSLLADVLSRLERRRSRKPAQESTDCRRLFVDERNGSEQVTLSHGHAMSKKETEALRRAQVRVLFATRPFKERTANAVPRFYGWLRKNYPELLPREKCDPYQSLTMNLIGLYTTVERPVVERLIKRRQKPVARCPVCGKVRYSIDLAKKRCAERYDEKRCRGVNRRTIRHWSECPFCAATGWEGNRTCHRCEGSGWLFARR